MTPEQFSYWFQGFVELNGGRLPSLAQWKSICEHLSEVFHKVTPPVDKPSKVGKDPQRPPINIKSADLEKLLREFEKDERRETVTCGPYDRYVFPGLIC